MKTLTMALFLSLAAGGVYADDAAAPAEGAAFEITGDAEAGAKVFRKCKACHMVGADAKNRVGPVLNGVVGRMMGSAPDFAYSDAMMALNAEEKIWTPEELMAFLTKPKDYLDGTKMAFAGLRKEADRENIVAYLASFNAEGESAE